MTEIKPLRRLSDRVLAGVCSGVAKYFEIDVTLVRVIWTIAALTGAGFVAYLVCWILIPEEEA